jgi:drug/metabolite transporter (DMT)-like permease
MSFIWITIPYALVYWGEQYISSGLCAILFATIPFYVAIFAHFWIVDEKLNMGKVAGLVVGFIGLILIFYDSINVKGENVFYGVFALTISPILAAIANVLAKRRIASLHPVSMNAWMMAYGAIFLLAISLLTERGQPVMFTGMAVFSLFYLGMIGSALAFVVYVYLLRTEAALKMSLIAYITPVIALFVGWLFRGETVTVEVTAGVVLVFLGVYLVTKRGIEVS